MKMGKRVVFFVGGFNPRKGIDKLMEAFSRVVKEQPNVELWICGKWNFFDGWALALLKPTKPRNRNIKREATDVVLNFRDIRVFFEENST